VECQLKERSRCLPECAKVSVDQLQFSDRAGLPEAFFIQRLVGLIAGVAEKKCGGIQIEVKETAELRHSEAVRAQL
jgi:hypothetical protein